MMADIPNQGDQDIRILDGSGTGNIVDIRTDIDSYNRLAVDAAISLTGGFIIQPPYTFAQEYTGQQNATILITPTSGKKLVIYGVVLESNAQGTPVSAEVRFGTSNAIIWKNYGTFRFSGGWIPMTRKGNINETIILNTTGLNKNDNVFVCVAYGEE